MAIECVVVQFVYEQKIASWPLSEFYVCTVGAPARLVGPFENYAAAQAAASQHRWDLIKEKRKNLWPVKSSQTVARDKLTGVSVVRVIVWFDDRPASDMQPDEEYWIVMRGPGEVIGMLSNREAALALADREIQANNEDEPVDDEPEGSDGVSHSNVVPTRRRSRIPGSRVP